MAWVTCSLAKTGGGAAKRPGDTSELASSCPSPSGIPNPETPQRPTLHSIQTVIPTTTVQPPRRHCCRRNRATTDAEQPATVNSRDRQAGPGSRPHQHAPPHIVSLAPTNKESATLEDIIHAIPFPPAQYHHPPSSPIPIPSRKRNTSRPTTPLTARAEPGNFFPSDYYITPRKSLFPGSGRGEYHLEDRSPANDIEQSPTLAYSVPIKSTGMRRGQTTPMYTPTSPLSPTMPAPPVPSAQQAHSNTRRTAPGPNLRLTSLPRFHPANFPSNDSASSSSITSPRNSRPPSSQYPQRPLSEAQFKLQQYQRDLVANATRVSRAPISPTVGVKPSPPRLHPLGSPGPVTPMMLEGQGDYLIAGAGGSNHESSPVKDGREMVEKMIQQENERRNYPGREERISPAVSPAGGRG